MKFKYIYIFLISDIKIRKMCYNMYYNYIVVKLSDDTYRGNESFMIGVLTKQWKAYCQLFSFCV